MTLFYDEILSPLLLRLSGAGVV